MTGFTGQEYFLSRKAVLLARGLGLHFRRVLSPSSPRNPSPTTEVSMCIIHNRDCLSSVLSETPARPNVQTLNFARHGQFQSLFFSAGTWKNFPIFSCLVATHFHPEID